MAEFPEVETDLVISGREVGVNQTVSNLSNMHEMSRHDIIVVADGDMRVGPGYLRAVAGGFADPSVGMVTCPYRGAYPVDTGAALEALTIDTDFLPSVAVAERLEGLSFALGATMAARKKALDAIGGFKALADYLADDYQFGNKIKKAGYKLLLSRYVVDSIQGRESIGGYFSHQLRWGRTYRACRPNGYFLSVLTKGTAFSVMFLLASGFDGLGWTVFGAGLAIRYVQAAYLEAVYIKGPGVFRYLWLLPIKDMMSFAIWALSFTGSTVKWKGTSFRIDREGRMTK
jgi:ceramide glucosyltransferase